MSLPLLRWFKPEKRPKFYVHNPKFDPTLIKGVDWGVVGYDRSAYTVCGFDKDGFYVEEQILLPPPGETAVGKIQFARLGCHPEDEA